MNNLSELARGGTICLSKAGLVAGTTVTLSIAAPNGAGVDFAIGGKMYHKADTANISITAAAAQAALRSCLYLVCLDKDGTLSTVKGTAVTTADIGVGSVLNWPEPAANTCPIGAFRIDTATGYTFTAGTTNLSGATGMTYTWYDILLVPDAPLTS